MKTRILALALALTMTLPAALGADLTQQFPATEPYVGFVDMAESHWAFPYAKLCNQVGLIRGIEDEAGKAAFRPGAIVSVGEAAAIVVRLSCALKGETPPESGSENAWYTPYTTNLTAVATNAKALDLVELLKDGTQPGTRGLFFSLLALTVPQEVLPVKNNVTALPDTDRTDVLKLYNAGILSGVDEYGTFSADKTLSRGEMAAAIARIIRPELALTVTLKTPEPKEVASLPSLDTAVILGTHAASGATYSIPLEALLPQFMAAGTALKEECDRQGLTFSWANSISDTAFPEFAMNYAANLAVHDLWVNQVSAQTDLPVWKAKHILVESKDTADTLRAQLKATGDSQTLFTQLMEAHSTDPGSKSQPEGYVFGPGQMVAPFETGTKALAIGAISDPVKSEFGYHIILRLPVSEEERYTAWREGCSFSFALDLSPAALTAHFDAATAP